MTDQNHKSFADLKHDADGKWEYIFQQLAPELADAMAKSPQHVPCPVHGGKDGFRLLPGWQTTGKGYCNTCLGQSNGFWTLAWVRGYSIKDATREIAEWLRGDSMAPRVERRPPPKPPQPVDRRKAYAKIHEAWTNSVPLKGTPAERYLAQRGIWRQNMPHTLRAHPGLKYWDNDAKTMRGPFPTLLAPIKDPEGRIISLHRIFLTPEGGKADVAEPKKMMQLAGEVRGAAIKLFQTVDGEALGLAEGIETALAAYAISRMPVWSCVSATLLELVQIPESVRKVVIWADLDRKGRGQQAAATLAERLRKEGKEVEICLPTCAIPDGSKGVDWLDVLLNQGLEGFPVHWRRWNPELDLAAA